MTPALALFALLAQTPAAALPAPPSDAIAPLSRWTEEQLQEAPYTGILLEALLREAGRASDTFHAQLFACVITMANAIGAEEEPQAAITRALTCFTRDMGFHACAGPPTLDDVLPDRILHTRRASPALLALLFLSLIERQTFSHETEARFLLAPFLMPDVLVLRYTHGHYHFNVLLEKGGLLLSDRELLDRMPLPASARENGVYFRALARSELAGLLLGELAHAFAATGNEALQEQYLGKAIERFPLSVALRLTLARTLLRTGQREPAATHVDHVLRRLPEQAEARFLKGLTLFAAGDDAGARAELTAAAESGHTEQGKVWLYLARMASRNGSLDELTAYLARFTTTARRHDLTEEIEAVLRGLVVDGAIRALQENAPYPERFRAAALLARHVTAPGNEALIAALSDANLRFRAYVWETLCGIAGRRIPPDQESWYRWHAAQTGAKGMALWSLLDIMPAAGDAPRGPAR